MEAVRLYEKLHGARLVTRQTGTEGVLVRRLYVEEPVEAARELYLALLLDRETSRVRFWASPNGGVGIEDAEEAPSGFTIDPALSPTAYDLREVALALALSGRSADDFSRMVRNLYRLFRELDASLVEINPLALLSDGSLVALDGKVSFDDNAIFRHPEFLELRDPEEEDPKELEASKYGLSYVPMDGSIGCLVNGAGLAMATLDAPAVRGGRAANFLDIGKGIREEGAEARQLFKTLRSSDGKPRDVRFAKNMDEAARLAVGMAGLWEADMAILVDRSTRLVIQGITGSAGAVVAPDPAAIGQAMLKALAENR